MIEIRQNDPFLAILTYNMACLILKACAFLQTLRFQ